MAQMQARKGIKAAKEWHKYHEGSQGKTQMQARNSTNAGTEKRKIKVGKERLPRKGTKAGTKSHKCRRGKPQR
jgi:hypothetical protein